MNSFYMKRASELALRGKGSTSTNPCVGAVVVNKGKIVGSGWHMYQGGPHAEINALADAGDAASGADLYVTLEPCSTHGRTPPCTDSIIACGIKKVFIGVLDPNPIHSGQGVTVLKNAGVDVEWGVEMEECAFLISDFTKYITTGLPYVTMKIAQSIDGKIATITGQSKWITCEKSREAVHVLRRKSDAVLVGIGTVLHDDPELTVRVGYISRQPLRAVLDSKCRIPLKSRLVETASNGEGELMVFTTNYAAGDKVEALRQKGVNVKIMGESLNLETVLRVLAENNIMNVMVEGGSMVFGSFISSKLVDNIHFFISPMIIGGDATKNSVGGAGILDLSDATILGDIDLKRIGSDIWVSSRITDYSSSVISLTNDFILQ